MGFLKNHPIHIEKKTQKLTEYGITNFILKMTYNIIPIPTYYYNIIEKIKRLCKIR